MNRRGFLASAAGLPLLAQPAAKKWNIVLIVADDLGYGDLGCYGQERIRTPRIDRMAAEGTRFTNAYAGHTVCAPSRCSLFTGLHTGHARMRGNTQTWLRPQDVTIGEVLKRAGYRTGVVGKWSLGPMGTTGYALEKGIDEFFGYFSQSHAHTYYPQVLLDGRRHVELRRNWSNQPDQYAHDLFTERALRFIDDAAGPFFLHVAYTIPHANNEKGKAGMEVPSDEPYSKESWPQNEKNFAAMITRMDGDVGKILDLVRAKKLENDTLVIFTSDNGPHAEGGHDPNFFRSSGPLRGIKRDLYDGGIRVPAIAWCPGRVPQGSTSDVTWAFWDLLPTFAEMAGVPAPEGLDGHSISNALHGRQQREHEFLYWEAHERGFKQAVRHGHWKAVRPKLGAPLELYDLRSDLGEQRDIASQNSALVQKIEEYLKSARTESPEYPVR